MADFKYEIIEEIGIFNSTANGWTKELNLISWNDSKEKFDIRSWSPERNRMGKGISLSKEEIIALRDLLNDVDFDNFE